MQKQVPIFFMLQTSRNVSIDHVSNCTKVAEPNERVSETWWGSLCARPCRWNYAQSAKEIFTGHECGLEEGLELTEASIL